jgi:hypothetical protein
MWQGVENWLKWKNYPNRVANEAKLNQWLEEPTNYDTYVLGTHFAKFQK